MVATRCSPRSRRRASPSARERAASTEVREALTRSGGDVRSLEAATAAFKHENARLEAAAAAQERIIAYRQSFRWWITLPLLRVRLWWRRLVGR